MGIDLRISTAQGGPLRPPVLGLHTKFRSAQPATGSAESRPARLLGFDLQARCYSPDFNSSLKD